jgi:hypothetical protein
MICNGRAEKKNQTMTKQTKLWWLSNNNLEFTADSEVKSAKNGGRR